MSKSDFDIDRHRLDDEWIVQAPRRRAYGERAANARKVYAEMKKKVSVIEAEVYLEVMKDPTSFELSKPTVDAIKAAVTTDKRCLKTYQEMVESKHELDILEAAVEALDDRKRALPDLVRLHLADYFAEPDSPGEREARDYVDKAQRKKSFKPVKRRKTDNA